MGRPRRAGPPVADATSASATLPPLELLKAIGDDTRYAILLAVAEAGAPMTTAELSSIVGLHANTVRPHLDRMREVGLVVREVASGGGVGRPRHTYRLASAAPLVGAAQAAAATDLTDDRSGLERLLVDLAAVAGATDEAARRVGFEHGAVRAEQIGAAIVATGSESSIPDALVGADGSMPPRETVEVLLAELERLGFGPRALGQVGSDGRHEVRIDFTTCPFEDGSADAPELACSLHAGIVAGLAAEPSAPADVTLVTRSEVSPKRVDCYARVAAPAARYDSSNTAHRSVVASPRSDRLAQTKEQPS